jgi:hypothetical protein
MFGLEPLNDRTRVADPMEDCFDFSQKPLSPPVARREPEEVGIGLRLARKITSDYWTDRDELGYETYAEAISSFIQHPETIAPLTIGITASWGAGKTSLMRMVQSRLDPKDEHGKRATLKVLDPLRTELLHIGWLRRVLRLLRRHPPEPEVTVETVLYRANRPATLETQTLKHQVAPTSDQENWRPTVWFNPWMYQSGEQIWAGLAHEIIKQVTERMERVEREAFWLALNVQRLDGHVLRHRVYRALLERLLPLGLLVGLLLLIGGGIALLGLTKSAGAVIVGGSLLTAATGVKRVIAFLQEKASASFKSLVSEPSHLKDRPASTNTDNVGPALIRDPGYESHLGFLHLVQTDMRAVLNLVATPKRPLIIFVDDLDRCLPSAVVQVIEAINLFLAGEFPNCVFILALEPAVVAVHIEVAYRDLVGNLRKLPGTADSASLGWRFLDKIVQLPLRLPGLVSQLYFDRYLDSLIRHAETSTTSDAQPRIGPPALNETQPSDATAPNSRENREAGGEPVSRGVISGSAVLIEKLAAEMMRRHPGVDSIYTVARDAQHQLLKKPADAPLTDEARVAVRRVLVQLFSSDNPEFQKVVAAGIGLLASKNPRTIKRFINLFRFYATVGVERRLVGLRGPDLEQAAKLAALAIRWPYFLDTLGRPSGDASGGTWLARLEDAAWTRFPAGAAMPTAPDREEWTSLLESAGLVGEGVASRVIDSFRDFLSSGATIGDVSDGLV